MALIDGTPLFRQVRGWARHPSFVRYKRANLAAQGFNMPRPDEPLPSRSEGPPVPIADRRRSPPASPEEP
jgi:hypothetical protein